MEAETDGQVLVAYATKYGATAEIAEKIGQVLRQAGLDMEALWDLAGYPQYVGVTIPDCLVVT